MERFLKDRPESIYRAQALDRLGAEWWRRKDYRKMAENLALLRAEKIGAATRDAYLLIEAGHWMELDEPAEAIRVLGLRRPDVAPAAKAERD